MMDDFGNEAPYVTPRELSAKLDEVYEAIDEVKDDIGGKGGLREELSSVKAWQKILAAAVPLTIAFGPEAARALPIP